MSTVGFIGVLDIYGFENFENDNGFEQLLINYANEKLQNHFNKHIFLIEQMEYNNEGIDWSYISFNDNQPCVDLIDGKPSGKSGIFQTLDDSFVSGRGDVNANFLFQINVAWSGNHPNFLSPRFNSDKRFGILHYAGEVYYEIAGFSEKNRDSTNYGMKELMAHSTNPLLKLISEESLHFDTIQSSSSSSNMSIAAAAAKKAKKIQPSGNSTSTSSKNAAATRSTFVSKLKEDSISKQFCNSLKLLYETLDATEPHFVRCVKPNNFKASDSLNAVLVMHQLRYAGMMETIRIRQQGYAVRMPHDVFFKRFYALSPSSMTVKDMVSTLSKDLSVHRESGHVGTFKNSGEELEEIRKPLNFKALPEDVSIESDTSEFANRY